MASLKRGVQPGVRYEPKGSTTAGRVFGFLAALGDVSFSFAAHSVVLEIQATIKSTPERPSGKPMWKGSLFAYIIVALCYFPVALIGFYVFGNSVQDNILISLEKPRWLIAAANIFVLIHVIGSYQVRTPIHRAHIYIINNVPCGLYICSALNYRCIVWCRSLLYQCLICWNPSWSKR